jgi:hypothetical protein
MYCLGISTHIRHKTIFCLLLLVKSYYIFIGPMIEKMLVTCGTKAEVNSWMDALKNHVVPNQSTQSKPVSIQVSTNKLVHKQLLIVIIQVNVLSNHLFYRGFHIYLSIDNLKF